MSVHSNWIWPKHIKFLRGNRGQSSIECCLTFLPIFFLVMAALQFGGYFYQLHALYQAANKGVRKAVTITTFGIPADLNAKVSDEINKALAAFSLDPAKYTVQPVEVTCENPGLGNGVPPTCPNGEKPVIIVSITAQSQMLVTHMFPKLQNMTVKASGLRNHKGLPVSVPTGA